ELERIINKALEKDRNLRYQHAGDMRADLSRLKRDTESGKRMAVEEEPEPEAASSEPAAASAISPAAKQPSGTSRAVPIAQPISGPSRFAGARKWWIPAAAALIIAAAI